MKDAGAAVKGVAVGLVEPDGGGIVVERGEEIAIRPFGVAAPLIGLGLARIDLDRGVEILAGRAGPAELDESEAAIGQGERRFRIGLDGRGVVGERILATAHPAEGIGARREGRDVARPEFEGGGKVVDGLGVVARVGDKRGRADRARRRVSPCRADARARPCRPAGAPRPCRSRSPCR